MVVLGGRAFSYERGTPVACLFRVDSTAVADFWAGVFTACFQPEQTMLISKGASNVSLNPQPSTLNPQPSTLNPQPSTLNPQPLTLNPQPSTLHPPPSTLHPRPSTLDPQPSTLSTRWTTTRSSKVNSHHAIYFGAQIWSRTPLIPGGTKPA